jgi:hypothetical protein
MNKAVIVLFVVLLNYVLFSNILVYSSDCKYNGALPDASCTPGEIDKNITQDNIMQTICVHGYTAKVRPPVEKTDKIKTIVMQKYGVADRKPEEFELDHLISLELGGCPDCDTNLWPQFYEPRPGAHEKDHVENALKKAVCSKQLILKDAQSIISIDWLSCYKLIMQGRKCE